MNPRRRLHHEAPYWITSEADYFVTICTKPRGENHLCHPLIAAAIVDAVKLYDKRASWFCEVVMLMPDHVHMVVSFPPNAVMSKVVGMWKRALQRSHAIPWQRNFFDHRLRNDESAESKVQYILGNPVRAGLIENWKDWPYYWVSEITWTADGDIGGYTERLPLSRWGHRRPPLSWMAKLPGQVTFPNGDWERGNSQRSFDKLRMTNHKKPAAPCGDAGFLTETRTRSWNRCRAPLRGRARLRVRSRVCPPWRR